MIALADVVAGSQWFQKVVGLESAHGGSEYEMLTSGGQIVLQLHDWDVHEHPHLGDPEVPSRGNGVLLWLSVEDFEAVLERVDKTGATVLDGPLFNENALQREIWLEGPEGYRVVVAGPRQPRG